MADEFAAAGQWSILELLMRLTNHRPSSIVLIRPIKGLWLTLSHSRSEPLSLCVFVCPCENPINAEMHVAN